MKKIIFIVLIAIFLSHFIFRVYGYRTEYLTPFDPAEWKQKFDYSQWSTMPSCDKPDPHYHPVTCVWDDTWYNENKDNLEAVNLKKKAIGDDGLYTHVGWEYINGRDPTSINAEIPPFGKYLIGLSELVFKNQNIFALLSGIFALAALYFFSLQLIKDRFLAALPVILISFEPLFYTQLRTPLLDLLYAGLLFMTFTFALKKKFILSAIFLGLMAATKSPASTFALVIGVSVLYLLVTKQFKFLKAYALSLPIAGIVFLATYLRYFLNGHTFTEFLGVQKWIINFYAQGAKGSLTAPWELLMTGKFNNWWGQQTVVAEWHIGWVLLTFSSFFVIGYLLKKRIQTSILLAAIWLVAYLLFLSFVPIWSRYFLLALPFMYTLVIWFIIHKFTHHEKKQ